MGCVDGWVGHTGELPGYNTSVFYDTTTDTTVIVQTNSDIPSGDCPEEQADAHRQPRRGRLLVTGATACSSPSPTPSATRSCRVAPIVRGSRHRGRWR